jgi:DNA-binding transcriptional MocR family regulator
MDDSGIRAILGIASRPGILSFAGGLPDPKLLPVQQIAACTQTVLHNHGAIALQYGVADGVSSLAERLSDLSRSRGAECSPANVIPTTGSQQGIDLLANVFLNQGATIAVTRPTYLGALQIFSAFEPRYLEISCDVEGPILSQVEAALREKPAFFYVVSIFQNPTGTTISRERGEAIVRLCHQYNVPLVEDAAYRELFYDEAPMSLRAIESTILRRNGQRYEHDGRVLYLGTLSKVMSPGLRIGWIEAPSTVIRGVACLKQGNDLHCGVLNQLVAAEFLKTYAEEYWKNIRSAYKERRDQAVESVQKHLGPVIERCTNPNGGFFLWVETDPRVDTAKMLQTSVEKFGVAFAPGAPFFARTPASNTMRVSFSNLSLDNIELGIKALGQALRYR